MSESLAHNNASCAQQAKHTHLPDMATVRWLHSRKMNPLGMEQCSSRFEATAQCHTDLRGMATG